MDDGAVTSSGSGFYLHTEGFTYTDVYKLAGMLHYKFNSHCTVQTHGKKPLLYITAQSMGKFKKLVRPYFCESMLYKLNS